MGPQLDVWQGDFGKAYTDRNVIDWQKRLPAFRQMLDGLALGRVLEVGCNRGHNLVALRHLLGARVDLVGVEPNPYALDLARATGAATVLRASALDMPFEDGAYDLVFTAGVLIHIPPADLASSLQAILRRSRRYVLAIEYAATEDTVIPYRGHSELLWKRDFLKHYQTLCPDLTLVRHGYWDADQGFDRATWWLLEKGASREHKA
jgi:pseudaminic acid biosynthesis-associated methylase